jgi:signal transduction histidine kinase
MEAGRDAEGQVLRVLGLCWAAPLHANGELAGALCLGPRADGEPYDAADRELFMLLAEAASNALRKPASVPAQEQADTPAQAEPANGGDALPSPEETWEAAAARIAQAMQNPLSTIAAYAQMLPQNYASEDFRAEMSETVQREVERISTVVETLHGASLLPRINLQTASVNDVVRRALKWVETEVHEHMIQLEDKLDPAEPQAVLDSAYLVDALRQLLRNAIEAMPQGGVLRVGTRMTEGGCEIRVADSGVGLNSETARQIFQPFYSTKPYRLGLGLTMAQRIVEAHNGRLHQENTGGGASFSLSLPSAENDHDGPSRD